MSDAIIRVAKASDAEVLSELASETFTDTFGHMYPPEDLAGYLATVYAPRKLREELARRDSLWLIAELAAEAIGYAQAGPCSLPHPEAKQRDGELKRLYLRKGHQGRGVGQKLLAQALQFLNDRYPGPQWIGVFSLNHGAQRLYARHGFEKVGEYEFPVGRTRDREFILRRSPR